MAVHSTRLHSVSTFTGPSTQRRSSGKLPPRICYLFQVLKLLLTFGCHSASASMFRSDASLHSILSQTDDVLFKGSRASIAQYRQSVSKRYLYYIFNCWLTRSTVLVEVMYIWKLEQIASWGLTSQAKHKSVPPRGKFR